MFRQVFMLGIIMFNSIVMCMPHYDQPESFSNTIKIFNRVFLAVYAGQNQQQCLHCTAAACKHTCV